MTAMLVLELQVDGTCSVAPDFERIPGTIIYRMIFGRYHHAIQRIVNLIKIIHAGAGKFVAYPYAAVINADLPPVLQLNFFIGGNGCAFGIVGKARKIFRGSAADQKKYNRD
jgi:hypothetical protein